MGMMVHRHKPEERPVEKPKKEEPVRNDKPKKKTTKK